MNVRLAAALLAAGSLVWAEPPATAPRAKQAASAVPPLPQAARNAVQRVSAASLRGNLSFLASDLLEGRDTPSRGLDLAAEFIASRFRAAGLEPPPSGDGYFQIAHWRYRQIDLAQAQAAVTAGGREIRISPSQLSVSSYAAVDLRNAPVFKVTLDSAPGLHQLPEGSLADSIVLLETVSIDEFRSMSGAGRSEAQKRYTAAYDAIRRLKPGALVGVRRDSATGAGAATQLIDPQTQEKPRPGPQVPIHIHSAEVTALYDSLPAGPTSAHMTLALPAAEERPVALKNVVGVLRGSDPVLRDTYVIVTAHYDHIGRTGEFRGDSIYNGANDDGSGTASVIEIASALAASPQRPKRTLVFIALWGEEKGLLGSYYYTRNPIFPLEKTVADINLEHMGRTDDSEGPQAGKLSMTGFDYSDLGAWIHTAARQTGVEFYKREQGDAFFNRSDNAAFAEAGIPAHTLTVTFEFPDYHALGDHWDKIDYENLAQVNRTLVAAVWSIANRTAAPRWNEANENTKPYRAARSENQGNKTTP